MDLARIKQFVKTNGDKFIVVEDGEPQMVVMSFPEYERLMAQETAKESAGARPVTPQEEWKTPGPEGPENDFLDDLELCGLGHEKDAGIDFGASVRQSADERGITSAPNPLGVSPLTGSTPFGRGRDEYAAHAIGDVPSFFEVPRDQEEDREVRHAPRLAKEAFTGVMPLRLEDVRLEDLPI